MTDKSSQTNINNYQIGQTREQRKEFLELELKGRRVSTMNAMFAALISLMFTLGLVAVLVGGRLPGFGIEDPKTEIQDNSSTSILISFLAGMSGTATIVFLNKATK